METLVASTVSVRMTHNDSEPIASEAATAFLSRDEATGAERPLKPAAPGDRIMVRNPYNARANHPQHQAMSMESPAILGRGGVENGKKAAGAPVMPAIPVVIPAVLARLRPRRRHRRNRR